MSFKWYDSKVENERRKVGKATWQAAENLLTEANYSVPHDEGTLERSGIVTQGGLSGTPNQVYAVAKSGKYAKDMFKFDFTKDMKFYISYNTPYAIRLHENPQYDFRGQGEGKWLENTAKRTSNKLQSWIKGALK